MWWFSVNKISPEGNKIKGKGSLGGDLSADKGYDCADWNSIRERKGWTEENKLRKFKKWWINI